jgi:hypothetical protein
MSNIFVAFALPPTHAHERVISMIIIIERCHRGGGHFRCSVQCLRFEQSYSMASLLPPEEWARLSLCVKGSDESDESVLPTMAPSVREGV